MELRQIEGFFWIATLGSFSAAAKRLLVTQSAISSRLSTLEREIGERLIERGGATFRLTGRGLQFLEQSRELLDLAADMRARSSGASGPRGTLRLGIVNTIAHTWLPSLLLEVGRRHPGIDVDVHVGVSNAIEQRLYSYDADLAIIVGPAKAPGIQSRRLFRHSLAWVANADLAVPPGPVGLDEIGRHRLLTYERGTIVHRLITELFRNAGIWPVRLSGSNSIAAMVDFALHGVGICALPAPVVAAQLEGGQLRVLETAPALPDIEFHLAYSTQPFNDLAATVADIMIDLRREE